MRSQRDKRQALKTAATSQEESESTWQDEVTRLTQKEPSTLSIPEIKVLLVILAVYLSTAPDYDSQAALQAYLSELKEQLNAGSNGPRFVVRPP